MNTKLRQIINHYGLKKQLKYLQSEVFELNEAIIEKEASRDNPFITFVQAINSIFNVQKDLRIEHIKEELAYVKVMLKQIQLYYGLSNEDIRVVMDEKIKRELERIKKENNGIYS